MRWALSREALDNLTDLVPIGLHDGITRYYERGIQPGDFLTAIIENDLNGAFGRADDFNKPQIEQILHWFRWNPPASTWGYPGACHDYINQKETEG